MSTITTASHQWATRPDDERFTSLTDLLDYKRTIRAQSRGVVASSRRLSVVPDEHDIKALRVAGPAGNLFEPTHYAFGQLAERAGAPAGYLRTLPAPIAADALNYGLQFKRENEDIGVLLQKNGTSTLRAVTGPNYGRIWDADIVAQMVERFGDGVTGDWRVPGEFGVALKEVTKANTTIYAGDRDMFVFLADEANRIAVPNRRDGKSGELARGFYVWNSEVGSATFGLATFLFDFVCMNRTIWGVEQFAEVKIRHTAKAPDKFLDEIRPALESYAHGSAKPITDQIAAARKARLDGSDGSLDKFLAARFGKRIGATIAATHIAEENRPIENLWDASVAVTAYARNIGWQNERVEMERKAGDILALATA